MVQDSSNLITVSCIWLPRS